MAWTHDALTSLILASLILIQFVRQLGFIRVICVQTRVRVVPLFLCTKSACKICFITDSFFVIFNNFNSPLF